MIVTDDEGWLFYRGLENSLRVLTELLLTIPHRDIIDLILMDLHMPVMNGYEAAENIRSISSQVPIIAMTADVILGVRDKCEQSGIFHYISKPFNPDHFIQTIKDIIVKSETNTEPNTAVLARQLGLKNMGGNEELYKQVLIEYRNENQDTLDKLEVALREKRYAEATQIVHKVKSSSGSIGAKSLQDVAALLQNGLSTLFQTTFLRSAVLNSIGVI